MLDHCYYSSYKTKALVFGVGISLILIALFVLSFQSNSLILKEYQLEEQDFERFMLMNEKKYSSLEEYSKRFSIFRDNAAYIRLFNSLSKGWTLRINAFADLTASEFSQMYSSSKYSPLPSLDDDLSYPYTDIEIPDAVDWRTKNAVTPVKNQGQCACG